MADLATEVQSRYGEQDLIHWTNPANPDAETIDVGRLNNAASDVEGHFLIHAQVEYNGDDVAHIAVGVEGVVILLKVRNGLEKTATYDQWIEKQLTPLRDVTSRGRAGPVGNSKYTPSPELSPGQVIRRPAFDERRFRHITPGAPTTGDDNRDYRS